MKFETLEELQAYNKNVIENSSLSKIEIQQGKALNLEGLSYFERIITISQPDDEFKLDWSSYYSVGFADTFLPKANGYQCKGVRFYDGAELLNSLRKTPQKLLQLSDNNKLINIIACTYPKGVEAEKNKNKVQPSNHEIATFIEIDQHNNIDVSFKFGRNSKTFLREYFKTNSSLLAFTNLENKTFKTSKTEFQKHFDNRLSHDNMMNFVLKTVGVNSSSAYGNTNKGKLEHFLRNNKIDGFIYKNTCSNNQTIIIQGTIIKGWLELKYIDNSQIDNITKLKISEEKNAIIFKQKDSWSKSNLTIAKKYNNGNCPNIETPITEEEITHISSLIIEHIKFTKLKGSEKQFTSLNKEIEKQINNPFYADVNLCVNLNITSKEEQKQQNLKPLDSGNISIPLDNNNVKTFTSKWQKNDKPCEISLDITIDDNGKLKIKHNVSKDYLKEYEGKWQKEIKKRGLQKEINIKGLRQQVLDDFTSAEIEHNFFETFIQKTKALLSEQVGGYIEAVHATQKIAKNVWKEGQVNESTWHSNKEKLAEEHKQWPNYVQLNPLVGGATDGVIDEIVGIPMAIKGVYGIATDKKQQEAFKNLFTQEGLNSLLDGLKQEAKDVVNDPQKAQHFGTKTVVAVAATVLGVGIISKSGKISTVLKQTTDKLKDFASPKATKLLQDLKKSTRNVANEIGLNKWLKNIDEDLVEDVLIKASQEAVDKGKKLTFKQVQAFWKRGNDFNKKIKDLKIYEANEVWLTHPTKVYHKGHKFAGKPRRFRLDAWDNLGDGKIVSRKATNLSEIKPSTFETYLKEIEFKYPEGSKIANSKIGDKLYGKKFLEIPESNKTFKNIEEYKKLAKEKYDVEIIFQPE
jgi:hypothetical protein